MGRHTMSLWLLSTTASNHDHFPAGDFLAVRSGSGESCEKSGERRSAGKFVNATLIGGRPVGSHVVTDRVRGSVSQKSSKTGYSDFIVPN